MKNKLLIVAPLLLLGVLTFPRTYINANAALTAPASYDYSYTYSSFHTQFMFAEYGGSAEPVAYSRVADSTYWNYSGQLNWVANSLPQGFTIQHLFNRSNTSWTEVSTGNWRPTDTKIGSDSTVGSPTKKYSFSFDNQTSNDYFLYFDASSTGFNSNVRHLINGVNQGTLNAQYMSIGITSLSIFYLPAYTSIEFYQENTSGVRYFDAWYLKNLGVSAAYNVGIDDGYDNGYETGYQDGVQFFDQEQYDQGYDAGFIDGQDSAESNVTSRIGTLMLTIFGGLGGILDIKVFNDLTLGSIMLFPLASTMIFFIFKLIRGAKG